MRPNVILMLVDDLGYGDVSGFNEESKIQTPHIDSLMKRGVKFTDAHTTSALCTPSRYGILTGRYNWRSRLKNLVLPGGADPLIEEGRMTMAEMFRQNGYYTACVGKWHLGIGWQRKETDGSEYGLEEEFAEMADSPYRDHALDALDIDFDKPFTFGPNDYGFDYFFGMAASIDQPPFTYIENSTVLYKPTHISGVFPLDRVGATQQQEWQRGPIADEFDHNKVVPDMQKKVLELIEEHKDHPFFLYYPTPAVHGPILPPDDFKGKSGINPYADMVLYVDHMVGEITAQLERTGNLDNTIFIFTSDNGCSGVSDIPRLLAAGHDSSYVFRGHKGDIWEGGHRVPFVYSHPKAYTEGLTTSQTVCLSDMYATFAELLDFELPDNAAEDSFSFQSLLKGQDTPTRTEIVHSSADGSFSIREKEWKLELCPGSGGLVPTLTNEEGEPYQFYNLADDIGETENLAGKYPEEVERLRLRLINIIENGRSNEGPPQENTATDSWPEYEKIRS